MTIEGSTIIKCSDAAVTRVAEVAARRANSNLKLRIYIVGGGCSGFQYRFKFDDALNDDDLVINIEQTVDIQLKVDIVVDALSFSYLEGATIDYVQDLLGSRFIISNPNAQTTCGCGSSFSV